MTRNEFLNHHWVKYPSAPQIITQLNKLSGLNEPIKLNELKDIKYIKDIKELNEINKLKEFNDQNHNRNLKPIRILSEELQQINFTNYSWIFEQELISGASPSEVLTLGDWIVVDDMLKKIVLLTPNLLISNSSCLSKSSTANYNNINKLTNSNTDPICFHTPTDKKNTYREWQKFKRQVQLFFLQNNFDEIETPTLVDCPGTEPFLEPFITELKIGSSIKKYYLPTSPELNLKKALSRGWENIFEIKTCFRNGEVSPIHNFEFHMLEWYRSFSSLEQIKNDIYSLMSFIDYPNWHTDKVIHLTLHQAFQKFCNFDLTPQTQASELFELSQKLHLNLSDQSKDWDFDDLFHFIYIEKIEPQLANYDFLILEKYPPSQAALARLTNDGWGDRFEFYISGVEIANAFHELNDPKIQSLRFQEDLEKKRQHHKTPVDLDYEFLKCLESGMPPSSGIALGLERLFMMKMNINDIHSLNP